MTATACVPTSRHMSKQLGKAYLEALEAALANLGTVAEDTGRGYRTIRAYRDGYRRITVGAAKSLADYLRKRSTQLEKAADKLQRAINKEVGDA